ncbi:MAG: amino acid ABC transporter ATP-binding protein [Mageeibacillus sp.]|jgi:polar amino acid transport system ATP-binding protein|nr:amino acid ABC transporter ATP-binding protein [Mageeibacillus sp.]
MADKENTDENILIIDNIRKAFDDLEVLKGISLTVARGEVVAVIGPSGGGKSTLLRCATTLEKIDSGKIVIGGQTLCDNPSVPRLCTPTSTASWISEASSVWCFRTSTFSRISQYARNITEALIHVHKQPKAEADAVCDALLAKMDLSDKADYFPCNLSGGQQQRVSIARALAGNPEIIFFDEPTSALDPELTKGVLSVIRELAAENMTMVIVTHEMSFARDVADRIVFMDGGVIVEEGPAYDLVTNPKAQRTKEFLAGY